MRRVAALAALLLAVPLASCTDAHALALGVRVTEAPGDSVVVHVDVQPRPGSDSTRITVTATGQSAQTKSLRGASRGVIDFRFANAADGQTVSGTVVGVTWVTGLASAPSAPVAWSHTRQPLPPTINGVTVEEAAAIIDSSPLVHLASYYPSPTSAPCHAEMRQYVSPSRLLVIPPIAERPHCDTVLARLASAAGATLAQANGQVVAEGRALPDSMRQRWRQGYPHAPSHVAVMRAACATSCPAFPPGALDWPVPPDSATGTEYVWMQGA